LSYIVTCHIGSHSVTYHPSQVIIIIIIIAIIIIAIIVVLIVDDIIN